MAIACNQCKDENDAQKILKCNPDVPTFGNETDLLQQRSHCTDSMRVQQILLVDKVSLQEMLQHQQEGGHQILLQAGLCNNK